MKLILCTTCNDVVALAHFNRECLCGASSGRYTDGAHAEVTGDPIVLGISNSDLRLAAQIYHLTGGGINVGAWMLNKEDSSVTR